MTDKMLRFLRSIKIDNAEQFDIDFEMIQRNRFNKDQFDMVIVKKTPWQYHLLRRFQEGLQNITYLYTIRFSYENRPNVNQVIELFDEWYQSIYHVPHNFNITGENSVITFTYGSEVDKQNAFLTIKDFKDFLNFLNYEFVIVEKVEIKVIEHPELSKKEQKKVTKEAEKEAVESIQNEVEEVEAKDINQAKEINEERTEDLVKQTSDALLKVMEKNYNQMLKERERARLNRRGNYTTIEQIDSINANSGSVDFNGKIFSIEKKEFGESARLIYGVNDEFGGAIYVNIYESNSFTKEDINSIIKGSNVRVRGVAYDDNFNKATTIKGHYVNLLPPDKIEMDTTPETRVELHLHSNMSYMDAVTPMSKYCEYAKALGHKAMAITDHAVTQSYPDAFKAAKKSGIKMLYGVEFYMVDEALHYIKNPSKTTLNNAKYVVLDLETTGLSAVYDRMIEFGAVRVENGIETGRIDILVNPERDIPNKIQRLTNITEEMVENQPTAREVLPKILDFIGDAIIVTHNADFDFSFLLEECKRNGFEPIKNPVIDTLSLSRYLFPEARAHRLGNLCRQFDVNYDKTDAHRADYDASVLNEVWQPMLTMLTKENLKMTHEDLGKLETPIALLKHIRPYHIIALAKNNEGLKALYKLVSLSHIEYLEGVAKVPRKEIEKYRENLLLGSACFNGEVFRTARNYNMETLKEVCSFYDYIEIQPLENYSFLVKMDELSKEDVIQYLKNIVEAADAVGKPVCATGDVHYLTKSEKKFRDVFISAKGIGGANHPLNPFDRKDYPFFENPDQHYRSTHEMLEAMSFLGEEKAYEVTVTNTNLIANQIESLSPIPTDKLYTPKIENCENLLTDLCYKTAYEYYGNPLPEFIQKRLEAELNGIISNGYSVIYYIAHQLVKKANDDGYLVGSRGSVGSSLVATMTGITEVNPLPPHYRCPKCKHLEWPTTVKSGYDLPDKVCPECGTPLIHDGQNIPFETFLGFSAEKVPDIDLNFPGDYQARAHEYTKVLLGENNVFRAGTIETVAEKTAFGFARGYIERLGLDPNTYPKAKISYLASGCLDVKRTTGQHPGGIVVIPTDHDVYDFTPVQYPADDPNSTWKTTHFDFHSIHDTVLKLDLLGHVDPVALKMMSDLTGINIKDIPTNDKKVLSLFTSPKALEMKHDYLGAKTGALAIPEFGTEFVRGMLEEAKPTSFSDLVIVSGLSHGEGVWTGNAQTLIEDKIATINEVIGCRDDIMTYLISKGLPNSVSFAIMEDVRKGRGLKPEYIEIMKANQVPQYYIDSCNKIKYMFPKGHAVAYVTMGVRVGYFKVYYPLEFYATFFSVRSKQYDIETMIAGEEAIIKKLDELTVKSRGKGSEKITPKEQEQLKTLRIALEMVQRGYKFSNIDLYKSHPVNFVVDKENKALIPPFVTIDQLGENAANSVEEARKDGEFFSKEDLLRRTKLTSTNVDVLDKMGVLKGLYETDQLSLFDF